ncbi:hypothetical protein GCM10023075_63470 [Streptosporangium album]
MTLWLTSRSKRTSRYVRRLCRGPGQTEGMEKLRPEDIAEAVSYIVTRDRRVSVNEILIRAGEQTW